MYSKEYQTRQLLKKNTNKQTKPNFNEPAVFSQSM